MTHRPRGHSLKITDAAPVESASAGAVARRAVLAENQLPSCMDAEKVSRAARSNCTIVITGETGVGKGQLARWIHEHSSRASSPFVPVNCGAIPDQLVDSQLFGHVRGAFSGATSDHLGLVRAADLGTLLLDEVSELPLSAQTRLLRLLQEREVQPVGKSHPILVDVRVIAASNVDLADVARENRFRADLLFRLDIIRLHVPPLRERLEELPGLIEAFNAHFSEVYVQAPLAFEPEAILAMQQSAWPGNIRQLKTVIERLHVLCPGIQITAGHLYEIGQLRDIRDARGACPSLDRAKMEEVNRVLAYHGGSISLAALAFGVHRSTIYRWLRRGGTGS